MTEHPEPYNNSSRNEKKAQHAHLEEVREVIARNRPGTGQEQARSKPGTDQEQTRNGPGAATFMGETAVAYLV